MSGPSSPDLVRVQKISAACAVACGAAAIAVPLSVIATWALESPTAPKAVLSGLSLLSDAGMRHVGDPAWVFPGGIRPWQRVVGAVISMIPALIQSYGLLRARSALMAFARGEFFIATIGSGVRDYAAALFWSVAADLALKPVLSLAVTFANRPGHGVINIGVTSDDLFRMMSAGIMWVIAAALVRASALARENEQFV